MQVQENKFREVMRLFPTGVTVVTTHAKDHGDVGITISSFTSLSLEPPQILFCLAKKSKTMRAFLEGESFVVNILSANQEHLSEGFAKHDIAWDAFSTDRHSDTGCLLIREAMGHLVCEKVAAYDGADHTIIIGQVVDTNVSPEKSPLVRCKGQYLTTHAL